MPPSLSLLPPSPPPPSPPSPSLLPSLLPLPPQSPPPQPWLIVMFSSPPPPKNLLLTPSRRLHCKAKSNTIYCRRRGSIPGRNQPKSALVLGVCSLPRLCSQMSRLATGILGLGNHGNLVVELRCQSLQRSEVWHCIRLEHGIVSDNGRGPLLHISLDLRWGPFLEPAKERAGNNR